MRLRSLPVYKNNSDCPTKRALAQPPVNLF